MCDVCPPLERHERQQETDGQRGVSGVLLKACKGCGRLIPQALTMCEQCEAKQQSRHVTYNNTRRDPRAAEFYLSKEWRELRPVIMSVYEYVDIYALYVEHQLITLKDSDPIHHIIELEEDWEQRLNPLNLIPLSHRTHNTITALYKQSNASMKATQTQLRSLIDYHFKEAGGYEKVLCDRFLVDVYKRQEQVREQMLKWYPDFDFTDAGIYYNDFNSMFYIRARMWKRRQQ